MREVSVLSYRMNPEDGKNLGGVVPVGRVLDVWGDVGTEICVLWQGDESLCLGYNDVKFYHDMYVGDQMDFTATVKRIGNTSITCNVNAVKVATPSIRNGKEFASETDMDWLEEPILCAEGEVILVVKKHCQRGEQPVGLVMDPWKVYDKK